MHHVEEHHNEDRDPEYHDDTPQGYEEHHQEHSRGSVHYHSEEGIWTHTTQQVEVGLSENEKKRIVHSHKDSRSVRGNRTGHKHGELVHGLGDSDSEDSGFEGQGDCSLSLSRDSSMCFNPNPLHANINSSETEAEICSDMNNFGNMSIKNINILPKNKKNDGDDTGDVELFDITPTPSTDPASASNNGITGSVGCRVNSDKNPLWS